VTDPTRFSADTSPEWPAPRAAYKALVVDWGGVLTEPLDSAIRAWADLDGVDFQHYVDVMRSWLGPHQGELARDNPVAALERGEIEVPHFEEQLARRLSEVAGRPILATGLLQRMVDQFEHAPAMSALVLRARRAGLRTGLLSNSWGNEYPREGWDEMFDAIVISGEVGMRKPEPEIFGHVLDLLGVQAEETVFVDDLDHNVRAAAELGLVAVHHTSYESTAAELEALFGVHLRD
jgi:epoxide hydrolase-like predicted phosphatase